MKRIHSRRNRISPGAPALRSAILLTVLGALLLAPQAAAQVDFGVRGGVYTDEEDPFAGVELLGRFDGTRWYYNPNVEVVFVDNGDLITANADFHYDLPADTPFDVWLGGGGALIFRDRDTPRFGRDDDSETDGGINLLGGLGFNRGGDIRPYIQGKLLLSDDSQAVVAFGLRFF